MIINYEQNPKCFGGGWFACFNDWKEHGNTKQESKQNLVNAIEWYFKNEMKLVIKILDFRVLCLYQCFEGFAIDIYDKHSKESHDCVLIGRVSKEDALTALQNQCNCYVDQ